MKSLQLLFVFFTSYAVISYLLVFLNSKEPKQEHYDALIVLGVTGKPKSIINTYKSLRLDKAVDLYNQNFANQIIVSGGSKEEGPSEAQVMEDYLIKHGIPKSAIIQEDKSLCTDENIIFSKEILDKLNMNSSLLITSNHHTHRTGILSKRYGLTNFEVMNAKNNFLSVMTYIPLRIRDQTKVNRVYPFRNAFNLYNSRLELKKVVSTL